MLKKSSMMNQNAIFMELLFPKHSLFCKCIADNYQLLLEQKNLSIDFL